MRLLYLSLSVPGVFLTSAFCWGQTATIQFLEDIPGGQYGGAANAISADGTTVVGWGYVNDNNLRAFRWRNGQSDEIGTLPGLPQSEAVAVSADGSVVIGNCSARSPFRWTANTGILPLELPPGATEGTALAISADGRVIVGNASGPGQGPGAAFRWESGTSTYLPAQVGPNNWQIQMITATAISADGEVIYGKARFGGWLRYTARNLYSAPSFLPDFTFPNAVSADGEFVALSDTTDPPGGFGRIWSERSGFSSAAGVRGLNADGSVAVGFFPGSGDIPGYPIIWDQENGSRNLQDVLTNLYCVDLAGHQLSRATGISSDGRAVPGEVAAGEGGLIDHGDIPRV